MVSTKGRRKIVVDGRRFVWYVCEDPDSSGHILHVISEDKRFLVQYHLGQEDPRFVIVVGREFRDLPEAGCHRRFLCPVFEQNGVVGPKAVRDLIEWGRKGTDPLVEVDWRGQRIVDGNASAHD